MPHAPLRSTLPILAALALAGCASADGAERRQLDGLSAAMKDDTATADARSRALEPLPAPEESPAAAPPRGAPSPLRSVAIGAASEVPDDGDEVARPEIKIVGSPGGTRKARAEDRVVAPAADDGPLPVAGDARDLPAAMDPAAKAAYDAALKHVFAKRYDEGLEALAAFLVKWPDHPNADNATYWRGECYFAKGELAKAAEQFEGVVARFPLGNKVPDALLKLGQTYRKLGQEPKAKTALERLQKDYPRSDAARRLDTAGTSAAGAKERR